MSDERRNDSNPNPDPNPNPSPEPDWSRFDPHEAERTARRAERDARDAARDAEHDARDAARDAERAARDAGRDAERRAREAEREARHAERHARREERRQHAGNAGSFTFGFDAERFAKRFVTDFVSDATGDTFSETVQAKFTFERMPRLRIRNISGETRVKVGDEAGTIEVVARKHVTASSEDRAKRLLQNLEIRMEKNGDELRVEPHLYEQERGWVDLFRGKRFRVDFEVTVPRECGVDAQTVSGDLAVSGVTGPLEVQSVSGDVSLADVQGPLRLKSVSGDVECRRYVGHVDGNTVSGDVTLDAVRIRSIQLHTVSGDVDVKGVLEPAREHRFRTISGDVALGLVEPDLVVEFRTASGDLESDLPARVNRLGRKEYEVSLGDARGHAVVKTVSGDLAIRSAVVEVPGEPSTEEPSMPRAKAADAEAMAPGDIERTEPMDTAAREEVRGVLERLAKGELSVDDAAAALDAARRAR